ncbi:MAG TPA: hypothetical protein VH063_18860 [Gaiellaceae bacterium]|jgi:hypothetical protein|nr:hypothetical protein [Gaiellaceae bacterium]
MRAGLHVRPSPSGRRGVKTGYRVTCQDGSGKQKVVDVKTAANDRQASDAALKQLNSWRVLHVEGKEPRG